MLISQRARAAVVEPANIFNAGSIEVHNGVLQALAGFFKHFVAERIASAGAFVKSAR